MKIFASIAAIANKIKHDKINAFAAESALFIIMSFIPFLILLMFLVRYTPLTEEMILDAVNRVFPEPFIPYISSNVHSVYSDVNHAMIFFVIISVLWAAGKGFVSLIDGLNAVFGIEETRNWIIKRIYAILYTLVFLVIIVLCTVIYILGYKINSYLLIHAPFIGRITERILQFRSLIMVLLLTLLFTFLYVAIPSRHTRIKRQLPGALFSAVGWVGFSFFFSLYVRYYANLTTIYGSLTTIVCVMLWLYVCMNIFLAGAEVNLFVEQWNTSSAVDKATDITHTRKD